MAMAISEEMQEALHILREDRTIKSFRELTDQQKGLVERMDRWESERKPDSGTDSDGNPDPKSDSGTGDPSKVVKGAPEPPPEITPEEKSEQKPKKKSRWWGDALPDQD